MPPGADHDVYARLVSELRNLGVMTVLDTDGEQMRAGLRAGPAIVAPNAREAEEAVGHEFNDPDDLWLGLGGLVEMGAGEAVITRHWGCAAVVGVDRRRYEVSVDRLEPVSTVGSGDCFLAGYVAAKYEGGTPADCLAYGVACGAESTQHFGAGTLDPQGGRAHALPGRGPRRRGAQPRRLTGRGERPGAPQNPGLPLLSSRGPWTVGSQRCK